MMGADQPLLLAANRQPDLCGLRVDTYPAFHGASTYLHRPAHIYHGVPESRASTTTPLPGRDRDCRSWPRRARWNWSGSRMGTAARLIPITTGPCRVKPKAKGSRAEKATDETGQRAIWQSGKSGPSGALSGLGGAGTGASLSSTPTRLWTHRT